MNQKLYVYEGGEIDLSLVTRLYPAALISAGGESASVSLEWADMKKDQVVHCAKQLFFGCKAYLHAINWDIPNGIKIANQNIGLKNNLLFFHICPF